MQTWITDKDFYKSATNLDKKRLHSQIYEAIHILASLLDCTDKLVNQKRNVKNHPSSILWLGYEVELLCYIHYHIRVWQQLKHKTKINNKNFNKLVYRLNYDIRKPYNHNSPPWITDELIMTHRSVLIQKEIEREIDLEVKKGQFISVNYYYDFTRTPEENKTRRSKNDLYLEKINKKIAANYHYRRLWTDCPINLSMRYDWRK